MNSIKILLLGALGLFLSQVDAQTFSGKSKSIITLNSPYNEGDLVLHPDGMTMAFSRANHPYNQGGAEDMGDVWISKLDSG